MSYLLMFLLAMMLSSSQGVGMNELQVDGAASPLVDPGYLQERIDLYDHWVRYEEECCLLTNEVDRGNCLFAEGLIHEKSGHIDLAVQALKASASLGNADAQAKLGIFYLALQNDGGPEAAIEWFARAARKGDPVAGYMKSRLGILFPEMVEIDSEAQLGLLKSSASSGYVPAINFLGETYLNGLFGVEVSEEQAYRYFRVSAGKNYSPGLFALGAYYVRSNRKVEGVDLLERAAAYGHPQANYMLGLHRWGQILESDASKEAAIEHFRTALAGGVISGAAYIGIAYSMGWGVDLDFVKARQHLKAAEGVSGGMAESSLAQLYARGLGVDQDLAVACEYYRKSAGFGYPNGQYGHGVCLRAHGEGEAGLEWIRKAAESGVAKAEQYLLDMAEDSPKE